MFCALAFPIAERQRPTPPLGLQGPRLGAAKPCSWCYSTLLSNQQALPIPVKSSVTPRRLALLSLAAACVTLGLKFGAYALTGSVGLYSDALESLVNLVAALGALWALSVAEKPADAEHPWGHEKAEYFSSGLEGGLIVVAAAMIIWEAVQRLLHPAPVGSLGWGLGISLLASAINGGAAVFMLRHAKRLDSIVIEADARHLLTDVWTSAGVVAGLGLMAVLPASWVWLDAVVAIAVALNIVATGYVLVKRSMSGLMDTALPAEERTALEAVLNSKIVAPNSYLELRTRKAGNARFVEFKLLLAGSSTVAESHTLCDALEEAVASALPRTQVTIHVEPLPD